jgi:hypothetical protein
MRHKDSVVTLQRVVDVMMASKGENAVTVAKYLTVRTLRDAALELPPTAGRHAVPQGLAMAQMRANDPTAALKNATHAHQLIDKGCVPRRAARPPCLPLTRRMQAAQDISGAGRVLVEAGRDLPPNGQSPAGQRRRRARRV